MAIVVIVLSLISLIQSIVHHHTLGIILSILAFLTSLLQIAFLHKEIYKLCRLSLTILFIALTVLVSLFILVKLISDAPPMSAFPTQCTKQMACSRVATSQPFRNNDITVPLLTSDSKTVIKKVKQWLKTHNYRIVKNSPISSYYFIHAVHSSTFWNFQDDLAIRIGCH